MTHLNLSFWGPRIGNPKLVPEKDIRVPLRLGGLRQKFRIATASGMTKEKIAILVRADREPGIWA